MPSRLKIVGVAFFCFVKAFDMEHELSANEQSFVCLYLYLSDYQ